jgi:hypothetical protein
MEAQIDKKLQLLNTQIPASLRDGHQDGDEYQWAFLELVERMEEPWKRS